MDTQNIPEHQEATERKGILKRLQALLSFGRPETTADLEQEIQDLLEEGEEQGLISSMEEKMINSIFDFRETMAAEIMTPAAEIVDFDEAASLSELVDLVIENGFTRIPVYRGNADRVIGIIHAKDLLKICARPQAGPMTLASFLRPVHFVPENKRIGELFREFQKNKAHMAMVTDEFGAVRGLITMEDIVEEIVGEIDDEYDDDQDNLEITSHNTILVHARVDLEKVEEHFGVKLPEGPYVSIGGLVIHILGRLGQVGDTVEVNGLKLVVKSAAKRHIKMIEISRQPVAESL
jgi:CBS domain containing-hemolysin-like protein